LRGMEGMLREPAVRTFTRCVHRHAYIHTSADEQAHAAKAPQAFNICTCRPRRQLTLLPQSPSRLILLKRRVHHSPLRWNRLPRARTNLKKILSSCVGKSSMGSADSDDGDDIARKLLVCGLLPRVLHPSRAQFCAAALRPVSVPLPCPSLSLSDGSPSREARALCAPAQLLRRRLPQRVVAVHLCGGVQHGALARYTCAGGGD
jgi:hypothetical protein